MKTNFATDKSNSARTIKVNDARNFVGDVFVRFTNLFCGVLARQDVVNALLAVVAACAVGNIDRNLACVIGELRSPFRHFFYGSNPHFGGVRGDFGIQVFAHAKRGDGFAVVNDEALTVIVIALVPSPDVVVVTQSA